MSTDENNTTSYHPQTRIKPLATTPTRKHTKAKKNPLENPPEENKTTSYHPQTIKKQLEPPPDENKTTSYHPQTRIKPLDTTPRRE